MADASIVLKDTFVSWKEIPTPTVVTVIAPGGYYPSKFKREQLAVIINFKGVQRRLPINEYSLKEIAMDIDYTMETKNWVGRKLQLSRHKTKKGGTFTINATPYKKREELRAIVS